MIQALLKLVALSSKVERLKQYIDNAINSHTYLNSRQRRRRKRNVVVVFFMRLKDKKNYH